MTPTGAGTSPLPPPLPHIQTASKNLRSSPNCTPHLCDGTPQSRRPPHHTPNLRSPLDCTSHLHGPHHRTAHHHNPNHRLAHHRSPASCTHHPRGPNARTLHTSGHLLQSLAPAPSPLATASLHTTSGLPGGLPTGLG
jgi:hypothetical protein